MNRLIRLRQDSPPGRGGALVGIAGPTLVVGLATLIASLVALTDNGNNDGIVMIFGINAIMVIGFQLFVGNTGIFSFGHIAFMALGAYAAGIVSLPPTTRSAVLPSLPGWATTHLSMFPSLLVGGAVAMAVALVTGVVILRLSGASASIATLGLLVITNEVISNATVFTRGAQSFFGVPQSANLVWVFATLVVVVIVSAGFKWSNAGLRSRAVRDASVAAETSGVWRLPARLWAFMLSAFITGLGGALYAHYLGSFSPNSFYVPQIVGILVMAIIGGLDSISGALAGAVLISALDWGLLDLQNGLQIGPLHIPPVVDISQLVLGVVLIAVLRLRPSGLFGALEVELDPRPGSERRVRQLPAELGAPSVAGVSSVGPLANEPSPTSMTGTQ